jgi:C1A family cysteine protease/PKD repeat protein
MRKIAIILAGLIFFLPITAQIRPKQAPLNPEFVRYIEAKKNGTLKAETSGGYQLNYIPSPLYLNFNQHRELKTLKSSDELPASYDLRTLGLVTPVKNQGSGTFGGNCVAFATMGSVESGWLVRGAGTYDLSEQNIAACYGYLWDYGEGANHEMATAYLSRFSGPVLEAEDPYNLQVHPCRSDLAPVALVPEARWLPKNNNLIKQTIMDYGGLFCSVHIDDAGFDETSYSYVYKGNVSPNHAWVVVGWNDIKLTPGGVGAWIIKNSWGDNWMQNGFVYCSYADTKIMSDVACFPERWNIEDIDTLYMYDYLGAISSIGYGDVISYGIAKFIAPEKQFITKVGTHVNTEGTILDFEIWDDFDGKILSNLITSKYNVYVSYPGYYTFDLPVSVNGDFYIKVKYHTPGNEFPVPVEEYIQDYANPVIDTSVNWISPDGINWASCNPDSVDLGQNLTIRAYAVYLDSPIALFESSKENVCLGSTVTFTFLENDSVTSYDWNFGSDASPATATGKGPHQVTYSTTGRKTVSLSVSGPGGSDTKVRHNYINIVPEIDVIIPESQDKTPVGIPYEITAFGADTYEWSPATYLNTTSGQTVIATPDVPGDYTYIVTGYQGTCSDTDTFTLSAKIRPINDNVCDALEIHPGGWIGAYPDGEFFNNKNATKETNEPAPPEGGCNDPMRWCIEGGVQNSVWFWFTATDRGVVSFNTEGFDEQIAIYRADSCADILEDKYILIAANDDYYDESYPVGKKFACALESVTVEPGKKYFVQIDGSAGGDEGYFSMIFWDYPMGVEINKESHSLDIYPNPGAGNFNFRFENPTTKTVKLEVSNIGGQVVLRKNYEATPGIFESSFDMSGNPPGIYLVRLISRDKIFYDKVILQ